ncbi:transporter substrate-binding domain-containing protein [Duganella sp. LX20W]|uniref:Transporter substrate-binding domain-containing protein n=1 Tax=Rugamonas brunnea TaxID=2758569 RepID=A0A7W2I9V9_9BURK|nr:transporter substrate-binding domain-containing protein [Rugamonas brunnea]MBA5635533.1 transporter substrate-binding domain-containing protein [Rugamonas brunnea]
MRARGLPLLPRRLLARLAVMACAVAAAPALATTILFPRPLLENDPQTDYPVALLRLALEKSGTPYELKFAPVVMTQDRVLLEIAKGDGGVDIIATMTSEERERKMLAVRIPIDKGLYGWRVPLVRGDHQDLFAGVVDLAGLRKLRSGQGHDWPDTGILRGNGVPVSANSSYEALFSMLSAGRIDYFPRAVIEIGPEAAAHPGLAIDRHIVIHYPTALYYFVSRNNARLADAVKRGLEAAIADGSFERLFNQRFGAALREARLDQRRVIELVNPLLPDGLPQEHRELWLAPDAGPRAKTGARAQHRAR